MEHDQSPVSVLMPITRQKEREGRDFWRQADFDQRVTALIVPPRSNLIPETRFDAKIHYFRHMLLAYLNWKNRKEDEGYPGSGRGKSWRSLLGMRAEAAGSKKDAGHEAVFEKKRHQMD
ncbi:hypothetical protein RvY_05756 [Ramazzottius varieornatus]|uniref:Uncharacterized protein n=1 Tax=Ramazzottius varieornatus TaxID=947166 RepID=A0A1D1UWL9_RAMVA|nr:hypothetical protein RvY_05756 [Ramazzottius varieornatus]